MKQCLGARLYFVYCYQNSVYSAKMGKIKQKGRKSMSESFARRPAVAKKKLNPFEMHVNRRKYDVLGRKLKSEKGLPGISRSKAIKKRKATILQEYKIKDKANKFLDRRIGERNSAMTSEDRVVARFTAERMKMFNKKQLFNLADDEVLTHRGQSLSEIEKFEDPRSDEDDDHETEEECGRLGADFVEDAHFGGGLLRQPGEGEKKSHKDLIEQLIAESKKRKAEKQKQREQTMELTEKLDTEWHDLLPIMNSSKKQPAADVEVERPDTYDTIMRELKFEARGKASDPLKSESEMREEEEQQRAELEAERQRRMVGTDASNAHIRHRSADDLDDGLDIEEDENEDVEVSYDLEGNMLVQRNERDIILNRFQEDEEKVMVSDSNEDVAAAGADDDDEDEEDDDDDSDEDDSEEEGDSLSDLKPCSESEGEATWKEPSATVVTSKQMTGTLQPTKKKEMPESERRKFLQKMLKRHPELSSVPEELKSLKKVLDESTAEQQGVLIAHIIAKNDLSLSDSNRTHLETLFTHLVQHMLSTTASTQLTCPVHGFAVLDNIAPLLYDLAHKLPQVAANTMAEALKGKQQEFQQHQHTFPAVSTLVLFKMISLLFPTSDFRHPLVTPALVFMGQMLFQCRVKTRRDVSYGLFLVALVLEFTVLSKRFSPAALNFLCGVVYLALGAKQKQQQTLPPFKTQGPQSELLLVCEESRKDFTTPCQMQLLDLNHGESIDDDFRIRALYTAVAMLCEFQENWSSLQAQVLILHKSAFLLSQLPLDRYPRCVANRVKKFLKANVELQEKGLEYLVVEKKRPKALRLYEPRVEENIFDVKKRRPMGKEKVEREKLLHKVKREQKAALREIRRDNAFISKLKWKETIQSDKERMEKVKEIFGSAANQQGELRKIEREKMRGKRT